MAVHPTHKRSVDPTIAPRSASATAGTECRAHGDLTVRAATGSGQRHTAGVFEGVRAAAAVMGWVLWLLLALMTAAFLAFAPSML